MNDSNNSIVAIIDHTDHNDLLETTLNSIYNQTYDNIKVIVVANQEMQLSNYSFNANSYVDEVISFIDLNSRRISLNEVVSSYESGAFIILKSGDQLSVDYLRIMEGLLLENSADVVISPIAYQEHDTKQPFYYNAELACSAYKKLSIEDAKNKYSLFSPHSQYWSCLSNKLWRTEILTDIADIFLDDPSVLITSILFDNLSNGIFFSNNVFSFHYFLSDDDLIKSPLFINDLNRIVIRLSDINSKFVDDCINKRISFIYELAKVKYPAKRLKRMFSSLSFLPNVDDLNIIKDNHLDQIKTELVGFDYYEKLKTSICNADILYVSFDIFDTLIHRRVLEPTDIFKFVSWKFNEVYQTNSYIDFDNIRKQSEARCRNRIKRECPSWEDITLDEIYDQIALDYDLDKDKLNQIKQYEIELEIKYCIARATGKELYDLCLQQGKKVICTSDMYLSLETVNAILRKNGYQTIEKVYLSSELRVGKATGNIFKYICKDLGIKPSQIMHIGDNLHSDVDMPRKSNICSFHLPKSIDLFKNCNNNIYKGNLYNQIFGYHGQFVEAQCAYDLFTGFRCMLAMVVNRFFDCPYIPFNFGSDFNADPYMIGYFALGMYLWGMADWLSEELENKSYKKIHFLARDGYLLKRVFDVVNRHSRQAIPTEYTYMSRNMVFLCDINSKVDIYALPSKMNVYSATPHKIISLFAPVIPTDKLHQVDSLLNASGIIPNKALDNYDTSIKFISLLIDKLVDEQMLLEYRSKLKSYFTSVFKHNECFFDVGYNGRVEGALKSICDYPIDSYYIHSYKEILYDRSDLAGFQNKCFDDFQPVITFLVREQILSDPTASASGISFDSNPPTVLFKKNDLDPITTEVTKLLHKGALDFANEFEEAYSDIMTKLHFRAHDAALPMLFYLHRASYIDHSIFSCTEFEDDLGGNEHISLNDFWEKRIITFGLRSYGNTINNDIFSDLYIDGFFVKAYRLINKTFPKGSSRRDVLKKIASVFFH